MVVYVITGDSGTREGVHVGSCLSGAAPSVLLRNGEDTYDGMSPPAISEGLRPHRRVDGEVLSHSLDVRKCDHHELLDSGISSTESL